MYILGLDIGGTKSAVILADVIDDKVKFLERYEIQTIGKWNTVIDKLLNQINIYIEKYKLDKKNIKMGISCGGPLDSKKGLIMSPPNLPGWDNVSIVEYIKRKVGISSKLRNDADACALAEWKFGAGKGTENMIFLTFGTGLGAGLILNGKLYTGTNDMAGEVGHIRLEKDGPIGYGKSGSFEGFCSGGGIAQIAKYQALELNEKGLKASYVINGINNITTKDVADSAKKGNRDAIEVFNISGKYFGRGLSILIDILNPEIIVVGSVYARSGDLLDNEMYKVIEEEALEVPRKTVRIVPALLGERIGDYGAVVAAIF